MLEKRSDTDPYPTGTAHLCGMAEGNRAAEPQPMTPNNPLPLPHRCSLLKRDLTLTPTPQVQLTCMAWLKELVPLAKSELRAQYADVLSAVLPTLSHSKPEIREVG